MTVKVQSGYTFAYVIKAEMSWYVQNYDMIRPLFFLLIIFMIFFFFFFGARKSFVKWASGDAYMHV